MITDILIISRHAEERWDENLKFRSYLKSLDAEKVDRLFHQEFETISPSIDCTQCGNCCKELQPAIEDYEIPRIAKTTGLSPEEFKQKFLKPFEKKASYLNTEPCHFLKEKLCSIYEERPNSCRQYPHLHHESMAYRLYGVIDNYGICPIVYHVIESLKQKLGFEHASENNKKSY